MKLKSILFCLLIACGLALQAQDYKVIGVESLPMDMTAREHIKQDERGRQCAVFRIVTQNIAPELREGFHFECDWNAFVVERQVVEGEIWVWVSPGLKTLKVKHSQLGNIELHTANYGITVEALHTYKIVIQGTMVSNPNEKPEVTQQYLAFQISPTNALLEVEGELWEVASDGSAMKFVNFGTYNYRVQAPNYHPKIGTVTVNDPEKTQKVTVTLKPDFVEVTLKVDADAEIWVNNEKKGTRTWTGNLGKGTYKIECKQVGHETSMITKEITADLNGQTIDLPKPIPIYGSLNIESTPNFATIYIDGEMVGETPKFVKEILVGEHEIRLTKDGYTTHKETVVVKKDERTQVKASLSKETTIPASLISQQTQNQQYKNFQYDRKAFVMANVAYSVAPQISYGLTFGSVGNTGWYFSVASNFFFKHAYYECDGSGEIEGEYEDGYTDYTYSDQTRNSRFSISAGMAVRIANPVSIYFGGGYGFRELFWILDDGTWVKNTDYSYSSVSFDGGLLWHFGNFGLSVGVQTIGFKYLEAKAGIGFNF